MCLLYLRNDCPVNFVNGALKILPPLIFLSSHENKWKITNSLILNHQETHRTVTFIIFKNRKQQIWCFKGNILLNNTFLSQKKFTSEYKRGGRSYSQFLDNIETKQDWRAEAITNLTFTVIGEAEPHCCFDHPRKLTKFTAEASCFYAEILSWLRKAQDLLKGFWGNDGVWLFGGLLLFHEELDNENKQTILHRLTFICTPESCARSFCCLPGVAVLAPFPMCGFQVV